MQQQNLAPIDLSSVGKQKGQMRINLRLGQIIKSDITVAMGMDGYSLKDMSTWVTDAASELISREDWETIVITTAVNARNDPVGGKLTSIQLPTSLWQTIFRLSLQASLTACSSEDPIFLHITISTFMRSAIIHKLYS